MKRFAALVVILGAIALAPVVFRTPTSFHILGKAPLDSTGAGDYALVTARKLRGSNPNDTSGVPSEVWLVSKAMGAKPGANKTVATLPLPALSSDERVFFGTSCKLNGQTDPSMVAVGSIETASAATRVRNAWRADTAGKTFVPLAPGGVTCNNPAQGGHRAG